MLTESPGLIVLMGKLLVMLYRAQGKWQHLAVNGGGGLTYVSYSVPSQYWKCRSLKILPPSQVFVAINPELI